MTTDVDAGAESWGGYRIAADHPVHLRALVEQAAAMDQAISPSANEAERLYWACDYFARTGKPMCGAHFVKVLECNANPTNTGCGHEVTDPYSTKIAAAVFSIPFLSSPLKPSAPKPSAPAPPPKPRAEKRCHCSWLLATK